jgi:hypothetical protein
MRIALMVIGLALVSCAASTEGTYAVGSLRVDAHGQAVNPRTGRLEQVYARYAYNEYGPPSEEIAHFFASDPGFPGVSQFVQPLGPAVYSAGDDADTDWGILGGLLGKLAR